MSGKAPLPHQLLWEARQLAGEHHMYVVEVHDKVGDQMVTAYVVYREARDHMPKQRLGKSRDPKSVLRLVKRNTGVTA